MGQDEWREERSSGQNQKKTLLGRRSSARRVLCCVLRLLKGSETAGIDAKQRDEE